MKQVKKFELYQILSLFKTYKTAKKVAEKLNISKSNLSYYTKKLKDLNVLEYIGKGVWEITGDLSVVQNVTSTRLPSNKKKFELTKQIRGHAFIWKVKFEKDIDWDILLKRTDLKYKLQSSGRVKRIFFEKRKIWLNKKGDLTIYEPFDYFGINSYESKGLAIYNLDRLLKDLIKKLKSRMMKYKFTTSRVHYSLIKNELARQYNESGRKLSVKTESGTEWLWIDNSEGLNELESGVAKEIKDPEEINKAIQDFWEENRQDKFETIRPKNINNNFKSIRDMLKESSTLQLEQSKKQLDADMIMKQATSNIKSLSETVFQLVEIVKNQKGE